MNIKKSTDKRPQCNLCSGKKNIYEIKSNGFLCLSICVNCIDKIYKEINKAK